MIPIFFPSIVAPFNIKLNKCWVTAMVGCLLRVAVLLMKNRVKIQNLSQLQAKPGFSIFTDGKFVCIDAYILVNNFSVMLEWFPVFLGWTDKVSCSRTQCSASDESRTSDPLISSLNTPPLRHSAHHTAVKADFSACYFSMHFIRVYTVY